MRTERMIGRGVVAALLALTAAGAGGCASMNNTEKGVGLGAAAGAGVGTLVGAATGNPKTGAVVGGLLGAGVGGAVGNNIDRKDEEKREVTQAVAVANAQAARRMGLTDVAAMAAAGHDEQVIINQIRNTGSTFQLSPGDLDYLKSNNVPPRVIVEMQNAKPQPVVVRPPRPVVVHESPAVIYETPPPYYYHRPRPVYVDGGFYHH